MTSGIHKNKICIGCGKIPKTLYTRESKAPRPYIPTNYIACGCGISDKNGLFRQSMELAKQHDGKVIKILKVIIKNNRVYTKHFENK
jgi:hypothetical protein